MEENSDLSKISLFINKKTRWVISRAKQISLPGFESIPIYDVVVFFVRGLQRGALTTRASSIAFHFALASLPLIIYFFTLIPYLPIPNFQEGVLSMVESILPSNVYVLLESTLRDMFIKRKALQLLGILIALFFATNAINVLIVAFNNTYHAIETRSWIERRAIAAFLVIIMFILIATAVSLIIFSRSATNLLDSKEIIQKVFTLYLFRIGKWIVIIAMIYSALSFLYWLGPSRKMKWKFYSAGSSLASVLVILTSLIFSSIINNFGQFNKFYGSIGTLMVILLWLYLNSIALLIGFELNASIKGAKLEMDNELPEDITEDG
ncbi:MAG: YihY/virulence factor BrkB family protein [Bacteroidales bacterium]|nr:YihY/virulence factor BrkB family protein [Bacteroidales bacterium]